MNSPIKAYITNLGKYNEGKLVGEWVDFPTTHQEISEVFERIGIGVEEEFGRVYEELFITDYESEFDGLTRVFGEYENLDELNYLAYKLNELRAYDRELFEAAMEISDYTKSVKDLINLVDNLDKYLLHSDINNYYDLGYSYANELCIDVPESLSNYIDYEAFGRDIALDEISVFSDYGYIVDLQDSFYEYYNGDPEEIPEEYLISRE